MNSRSNRFTLDVGGSSLGAVEQVTLSIVTSELSILTSLVTTVQFLLTQVNIHSFMLNNMFVSFIEFIDGENTHVNRGSDVIPKLQ